MFPGVFSLFAKRGHAQRVQRAVGYRYAADGADILSGDAYVFVGRRKDRLKLLVWEPSGFVLYYKRLEAGAFRLPLGKQASVEVFPAELWVLLEGLEVEVKQRRKRWGTQPILSA